MGLPGASKSSVLGMSYQLRSVAATTFRSASTTMTPWLMQRVISDSVRSALRRRRRSSRSAVHAATVWRARPMSDALRLTMW